MRRIIEDRAQALEALNKAEVIHLALCDEDGPYSVPVNFAATQDVLYLHSGVKGRKFAALRVFPHISFSAVASMRPRQGETACKWGYSFESVIGSGRAMEVMDPAEKCAGLRLIMEKYAGPGEYAFDERVLEVTALFAIAIEQLTLRIKE